MVQIFPDPNSVTRLVGAVLAEQNEEWQHGQRRYLSETSMRKLLHIIQDDDNNAGRLLPMAV